MVHSLKVTISGMNITVLCKNILGRTGKIMMGEGGGGGEFPPKKLLEIQTYTDCSDIQDKSSVQARSVATLSKLRCFIIWSATYTDMILQAR